MSRAATLTFWSVLFLLAAGADRLLTSSPAPPASRRSEGLGNAPAPVVRPSEAPGPMDPTIAALEAGEDEDDDSLGDGALARDPSPDGAFDLSADLLLDLRPCRAPGDSPARTRPLRC
jgi:hypothetical protein